MLHLFCVTLNTLPFSKDSESRSAKWVGWWTASWPQPSLPGPLSGRHQTKPRLLPRSPHASRIPGHCIASLPPTPRLTLRGSGSSRKSAVSLKTRTGGACGTWAKTDGGAIVKESAETSSASPELLGALSSTETGGDSHLHRRAGKAHDFQ